MGDYEQLKELADRYIKEIGTAHPGYDFSEMRLTLFGVANLLSHQNGNGSVAKHDISVDQLVSELAKNIDFNRLAAGIAKHAQHGRVPGQGVMPYTLVEASLVSADDHERAAEDLEKITTYLMKNGWNPDPLWLKAGEHLYDFKGVLKFSPIELEEIYEVWDGDDDIEGRIIRVHYARDHSALTVEFDTDTEEATYFELVTYHTEFRQGMHNIESFGVDDRKKLRGIVNELIKDVFPEGDRLEKDDVTLKEAADWYEKWDVEEE